MALTNLDVVKDNLGVFVGTKAIGLKVTPREGKKLIPVQMCGTVCKQVTDFTVAQILSQIEAVVSNYEEDLTASDVSCSRTSNGYVVVVILAKEEA